MRIAICDDSALDRELISELLNCYFDENQKHRKLFFYESGIDLFYDVEDGASFDIVLLDIYMHEMLGIDVAKRLRNANYHGKIVFITASSEFAVDSYDVNASAYLLKPYSYKKLCEVIDRVTQDIYDFIYPIRFRNSQVNLQFSDITYIESLNTKCIIHTVTNQKYTQYTKLGEIELQLNDRRFLRCHRSFIVNMDHIRSAGNQFILDSGELVLIRQRELRDIRSKYYEYCNSRVKLSQTTDQSNSTSHCIKNPKL
jgi:DNA-binding LytR/AlgR family response regulator